MKGRLVILSGPSGVGKDTVIDAWRAVNPLVERVVAYTTRDPRDGEREGVDYHFVSRESFLDMASKGDFLEHKEVHGNLYATPLRDLEAMLAASKIAILKIDVQGALSVFKLRPDAMSIFLLPPSWEELERRIRFRGTDDEAAIEKRLTNAKWEISQSERYSHQFVNDQIDHLVSQLEKCVSVENDARP